jgi:hypothetical protein
VFGERGLEGPHAGAGDTRHVGDGVGCGRVGVDEVDDPDSRRGLAGRGSPVSRPEKLAGWAASSWPTTSSSSGRSTSSGASPSNATRLTGQRRWWRLARTNVTATKARGVFVDGMVLVLDRRPGTVAAAETAGLTGRVDLLLTTLRPTSPRSSLGDAFDRLHTRLTEYRSLLRPGGHVVVTSAPYRHPVRHELIDVSSQIAAIGSAVGLAPVARCLALTADVHSRRVRTHAAFAERRAATRAERALGHPIALSAHHTALVFRADPDVMSRMGTRQGGNGPRSR